MDVQPILEVAAGLLFAWLILSLATVYLQEVFVSFMGLRSKMLEITIRNLLADPGLAEQFYNHPAIKSLHSGDDGKRRPAYIPPQQFALTLFDIVMSAGKEASVLQRGLYEVRLEMEKIKNTPPDARKALEGLLSLCQQAIASEAGKADVDALMERAKSEMSDFIKQYESGYPQLAQLARKALDDTTINHQAMQVALEMYKSTQQPASPDGVIVLRPHYDQLRAGLAVLSVSQPRLKQSLATMVQGAEEYVTRTESVIAKARENVENWFNNSMDRLSGWYKREAQKIAFAIGLLVAIALNVDTLMLAQTLWREPLIRSALAAQATAYVQQTEAPTSEQLEKIQVGLAEISLPIGWIGAPIPLKDGLVPSADGVSRACVFGATSQALFFGIQVAGQCYPIVNTPRPNDVTGIILKILGLLASGAAAAQGAPFWFDVLKKAINIRASGNSPAESGRK